MDSYGNRREEEYDEYPPRGRTHHDKPRPQSPPEYEAPSKVTHVSHSSGGSYNYPPTRNSRVEGEYDYPSQETNYPSSASVHHVSHQSPYESEEKPHRSRPSQETNKPRPQSPPEYEAPSKVTHVSHSSGGSYNYPPTRNSRVGGEYDYPSQETNYPSSASVHHVSHQSPYESEEKPHRSRPSQETNYSSYPTSASVHHVSHESSQYEAENNPHHSRPHKSSYVSHHEPQMEYGSNVVANKPTVRIYPEAETNYSLTIRNGNVILAVSDPSDPHQHWIKDEKYSLKVKDEEGFPSFALVNKATGEAIKHSTEATHPVQLTHYVPDRFDESILWTESTDLGDSYRCIRMVNNIRLNMDAFNGDEDHGGVHDGTTIVLWKWAKGDNQRWKIVPY